MKTLRLLTAMTATLSVNACSAETTPETGPSSPSDTLIEADTINLSKPWAQLASDDVQAYCTDIKGIHPGMVDPYAPEFAERVDTACEIATQEASDALSYDDWHLTMGNLVGGFRDGHTRIRYLLQPRVIEWPGFLIDGRAEGWYVRRPDLNRVAPEGSPPEGALFVGCDGISADDFLRQTLDPARADWSKHPERIRLAHRAFIHEALDKPYPAQSCLFQLGDEITEIELQWSRILASTINSVVPVYTRRGLRRDIDVEFGEDGHAWIRLANVSNETALNVLTAELESRQDELRSAPYVVFDMRGNGGGNSMWGNRLAGILWGEDAVEARRLAASTDTPGEYGKYWRGSQRASEAVIAEANEYATMGENWTDFAEFWRSIGEEMGAQETDRLIEDSCCQPSDPPATIPDVEYDGQVYVITDTATYSSGIVVFNLFKLMGAVQLGEPTGQNGVWGETVGPQTLPSGLGTYHVPVAIIRQPRRSLGGLPVDIPWEGAMDDDEGVREWVADLARSSDR